MHFRLQSAVRVGLAGILGGPLFVLPARAQQPTAPPTFSVNVKVVNVPTIVRDKKGKVVTGLTKDDFALEENGHPQAIKYFAQENDTPLTLGLLVDTSGSQRRVLDPERTASHIFLEDMLRPLKDSAFILHFDSEAELLQDITESRSKLEAALDNLEETPRDQQDPNGGANGGGGNGGSGGNGGGGGRGGWPGGGGGGRRGGGGGHHHAFGAGTVLYDAVYLSADEVLKNKQGRKAIILLTDGVDNGSMLSLDKAIEAAQRADIVVYAALYADPDAYADPRGWNGGRGRSHGPMPGGRGPTVGNNEPENGKKVLTRLCNETGGRMFEVKHNQTIEQVYAQISDELRHQYNLGYSSNQPDGDGFRNIHVTARNKELTVQARDGYYKGSD